MCLSDDRQAGIVGAIGTASMYVDDVLDINNVYFGNMVGRMCPSGLQLGGTDTSDIEAVFSDLRLSVSGGGVSTRVCDGRGDIGFEVVSFPFLGGGVPRSASCGSVSLDSFVLLGRLAVLLASALAMGCWLRGFLNRAVGVMDCAGHFLNFIDDAMIWCLGSEMDLGISCTGDS